MATIDPIDYLIKKGKLPSNFKNFSQEVTNASVIKNPYGEGNAKQFNLGNEKYTWAADKNLYDSTGKLLGQAYASNANMGMETYRNILNTAGYQGSLYGKVNKDFVNAAYDAGNRDYTGYEMDKWYKGYDEDYARLVAEGDYTPDEYWNKYQSGARAGQTTSNPASGASYINAAGKVVTPKTSQEEQNMISLGFKSSGGGQSMAGGQDSGWVDPATGKATATGVGEPLSEYEKRNGGVDPNNPNRNREYGEANAPEGTRYLGINEFKGLNEDWRKAGLTPDEVRNNFLEKDDYGNYYLKTNAPSAEDVLKRRGATDINTNINASDLNSLDKGLADANAGQDGIGDGTDSGMSETDFTTKINNLVDKITETYKKSPEEINIQDDLMSLQEDITQFSADTQAGLDKIEEQTVPLEFIAGQQAELSRKAARIQTHLAQQEANLINRLGIAQEDRKLEQEGLMFQFDASNAIQDRIDKQKQQVFENAMLLDAKAQDKYAMILETLGGPNPDKLSATVIAQLTEIANEAGFSPELLFAGLDAMYNQTIIDSLKYGYDLVGPSDTPNVSAMFPDGYNGGQCGTFARKIVSDLPTMGDTIQTKQAMIDENGIPASEWRSSPKVGDVLIMKTNLPTGHVAVVNSVNGDGTVTLTESNYGLDEKVTNSRKIDINNPSIYGAYRSQKMQSTSNNKYTYSDISSDLEMTAKEGLFETKKAFEDYLNNLNSSGQLKDISEGQISDLAARYGELLDNTTQSKVSLSKEYFQNVYNKDQLKNSASDYIKEKYGFDDKDGPSKELKQLAKESGFASIWDLSKEEVRKFLESDKAIDIYLDYVMSAIETRRKSGQSDYEIAKEMGLVK